MARVEWSEGALGELERLVLTHSLPADTRSRIDGSLRRLRRFPRIGPAIRVDGDGDELRFLLGPWPWLVIVYLHLVAEQRVVVVSVEDARAATATVAERAAEARPGRRSSRSG